ncbi:MAG: SPOR domain-containing protein [Magnetovibrio sp.]|nr:SPOR domain-containing protein [Magnetovibrio sp.]
MKKDFDSQEAPQGQDGYDENVPDASELLDFELIAKSPQEKSSGLWLWFVLILVLAGGGWAGWMYLQDQDMNQAAPNSGSVPVVLAPKFALKEKPSDPGGMKVPDRDKLVYDRMAGDQVSGQGQQVERLLPPPETPIEPPKASPAPAPAPMPEPDTKPVEQAVTTPPAPPAAPTTKTVEAAPAPAPKVEAKPAPKPEPVPVAKVEPKPVPKAVEAPKPAAKPMPAPAATKATGTAGKGYMIQLSAVRNEANAKGEWARLAKKHKDILGGLELVIQRADLGAKGVFYRVRGGWFANRGEAKAVCDALKKRSVGCLIAKP